MTAPLAYITINISPVLVRIGSLTVRWYGVMYAVGLALALWVTLPIAARRGIPRDTLYALFWGVTVAGLVGGRLYYVVQNRPAYYLAHPAHILAAWEGGMAFYGAVFLGVPALYLLTRRYRAPFLLLLDIAALFAPLTQTVGRIGNIINGDIVGYPSALPWATAYANPGAFARPLCTAPDTRCVAFQPAGAYELLFSLGLFALLWGVRKRSWPAGLHFVAYLALYSVGQLVLFIWRANDLVLGPLKQAQVTALVVLVALAPVAWWLYQRGTRGRRDRPAEANCAPTAVLTGGVGDEREASVGAP